MVGLETKVVPKVVRVATHDQAMAVGPGTDDHGPHHTVGPKVGRPRPPAAPALVAPALEAGLDPDTRVRPGEEVPRHVGLAVARDIVNILGLAGLPPGLEDLVPVEVLAVVDRKIPCGTGVVPQVQGTGAHVGAQGDGPVGRHRTRLVLVGRHRPEAIVGRIP